MKKLLSILALLFCLSTLGQELPSPSSEPKNDGEGVTLSMEFSPKVPSKVTGIRLYKSWFGNTTGQLWSSSGTLLSSVTFPETTAAGWVDAFFLTPVDVQPGQSYVVSYHTPGNYYIVAGFFPKEFSLYNATNSYYKYGATPAFPTSTYQQSNYYVEPIIFEQGVIPPPSTNIVYRDTCNFDWNTSPTKFVLMLSEEGGKFMAPDSTTVYRATFGAAPPHERLKDDPSLRFYRFTRTVLLNGVNTTVRFTLYKTGAWIRERQVNGVWTNIPY
jgi:hypothetical protein